jgi:type II secretory pathway pseudopilin PulG
MTLIELLVVFAIIAILGALLAAGIMGWMASQTGRNTEASIKAIYAILLEHWDAVVRDAKQEQIPPSVLNFASVSPGSPTTADHDRAKVILIKLRLMEAFPVNFTEVPKPGVDPYQNAPLALIPKGKRRFLLSYQDRIYDPKTTQSRWKTANLTGKESVESAVCLFIALDTAKSGVSPAGDQLRPYLRDTDSDGSLELADGWNTPLRFYRFATRNDDLQKSAPPSASSSSGYFDPLDPKGTLLDPSWDKSNGSNFDKMFHERRYSPTYPAWYAVPVLVSAGPDSDFGLPAVDANSASLPGQAPYQFMTKLPLPWSPPSPAPKTESDNVYSFKK